MVRCSECEKTFTRGRGISWIEGICHDCFTKPDPTDPIDLFVLRKKDYNPVDAYYDRYTRKALGEIY